MILNVPRIWEIYPDLAREVKDTHERTGLTASGHDADHDFEVGQLALIVAWPIDEKAATLAGIAGLLHSTDRILEIVLNLRKETISVVGEKEIRESVTSRLQTYTDITDPVSVERVLNAVVHHGSKPNREDDDLVTIALADGDRLANMSASLPIRSGQHNSSLRILNPVTIEVDGSNRSPREKFNNPDSVLWDIQNCIEWYRNPHGPYALRLKVSLKIGRIRAERLERCIQEIKHDRVFVGLYPYPKLML